MSTGQERAEIEPKQESQQPGLQSGYDHNGHRINHNGHKVTKHIHPDGESGRAWIHPWHFLRVCWKSSCTASKWVNVLWPFVPAAIAVHFALPHRPYVKFSLACKDFLSFNALCPTSCRMRCAASTAVRSPLTSLASCLLSAHKGLSTISSATEPRTIQKSWASIISANA